MKQNIEQVQEWLALSEGGYVNHPRDPGGATNMGVTQRTYTQWLRSRGEPDRDVREINHHEAKKIFYDNYYKPVRFDDLPNGLDYAMADYSVNSGPGRAAKDLQRVLRDLGHDIAVDGHVGVGTLAAVNDERGRVGDVVAALVSRRWKFMTQLRHFPTFKNGWKKRLFGELEGQQDWDSGVLDRALRMATETPLPPRSTPRSHETARSTDNEMRATPALIQFLMRLFGRG